MNRSGVSRFQQSERPAVALTALREQRRRQLEDRLATGDRWQALDYVFASGVGTALDSRNPTRRYHATRVCAGLPDVPWHHLRHFAATALLEAGEDGYTVSRVLGHASVATTAAVYGHVTPSMLQRSADRMDEVLRRASGA